MKHYLFILFVASVSASCPVIKNVDLKFETYTHNVWYQQARYDNKWEEGQKCISVIFNTVNDVTTFNITGIKDGKPLCNSGIVEFGPDSLLTFKSKNFFESTGTDILRMSVLSVDYDKYVVVYACNFDGKTSKRTDFVFVLTRSKTYSPEEREAINKFFDSTDIIDRNKLIWVEQTEQACQLS